MARKCAAAKPNAALASASDALKPPEYHFVTLAHYVQLLQRFPAFLWMYRGQSDISWPLRPKAGRPEYYVKANSYWVEKGQKSSDLGRFSAWRKQAVAFHERLPGNDFECLALAQHFGLATRLLDWSSNPLAALFFATEGCGESDAAVYCYSPKQLVEPEVLTPERCSLVAAYHPRPFDRRIVAQGGLFTFHPEPQEPLQPEDIDDDSIEKLSEVDVNLVVIRVRADMKGALQRQLDDFGINRKTLFPDLGGLSEFVNWETRRIACRREQR